MNRSLSIRRSLSLMALAWLLTVGAADACTRCLKVFADGTVVVGRSMDWVEDPGSELWIFPRGMQWQGNAGADSLEWTSRYGSVAVSFYVCAHHNHPCSP